MKKQINKKKIITIVGGLLVLDLVASAVTPKEVVEQPQQQSQQVQQVANTEIDTKALETTEENKGQHTSLFLLYNEATQEFKQTWVLGNLSKSLSSEQDLLIELIQNKDKFDTEVNSKLAYVTTMWDELRTQVRKADNEIQEGHDNFFEETGYNKKEFYKNLSLALEMDRKENTELSREILAQGNDLKERSLNDVSEINSNLKEIETLGEVER